MSDDDIERVNGDLGETCGQTLMRALDNITRLEAGHGGACGRVIVVYQVDHPADDDHPYGWHTIGIDNTPGLSSTETTGLLVIASDEVRYG